MPIRYTRHTSALTGATIYASERATIRHERDGWTACVFVRADSDGRIYPAFVGTYKTPELAIRGIDKAQNTGACALGPSVPRGEMCAHGMTVAELLS